MIHFQEHHFDFDFDVTNGVCMSFKQFFDRLVENSLVTPVTPNSPIVAVPCSFLPFPMLKYKHLFQIKYAEAILSNNSGKLLWFENQNDECC